VHTIKLRRKGRAILALGDRARAWLQNMRFFLFREQRSTTKPYLTGRAAPAAPTTPGAVQRQAPASPEVRSTKTWSLRRESSRKTNGDGSGGGSGEADDPVEAICLGPKKNCEFSEGHNKRNEVQLDRQDECNRNYVLRSFKEHGGEIQQKMGLRVPGIGAGLFFQWGTKRTYREGASCN